jgi:hypothetical protein
MKRRDLIVAGVMAIGFSAVFPHETFAAPEKASAAQLEVTYYYIPF